MEVYLLECLLELVVRCIWRLPLPLLEHDVGAHVHPATVVHGDGLQGAVTEAQLNAQLLPAVVDVPGDVEQKAVITDGASTGDAFQLVLPFGQRVVGSCKWVRIRYPALEPSVAWGDVGGGIPLCSAGEVGSGGESCV